MPPLVVSLAAVVALTAASFAQEGVDRVLRERVFPRGHLAPDTVAVVNGRRVTQDQFHRALVAESGQEVLRGLIKAEIIRGAAQQAGIHFTAEQVEAEAQTMLARARQELAGRVGGSKPSLEEVLEAAAVDWAFFYAGLVEQAELQLLLDSLVLYERLRSERVEIRLMQLASAKECEDVLVVLAQGGQFGKLALQRSRHASRRSEGLLPPFARGRFKAEYAALETAAFALKNPGDLSPVVRIVSPGNREEFFLVQLEQRHPASTEPFSQLLPRILDLRQSDPPSTEDLDAWMAARLDQASVVIDPK